MEGFCLYRFRKKVNIRTFYDNGGGYVHQSNEMVRECYLHLSDSKLQNSAKTTAHIYTVLARMFEKKMIRGGLFQLQMRISFPFLRAKHLRTSLLIYKNS